MRAFERKFRGGVIEAAELFPIARVMARFAGLVGGMRIGVTSGAGLIGEMILAGRRRRGSRDMSCIGIGHIGQRFVAVGAQHGGMSIDQDEFGLCVARQVERGGPEGFLRMAQVAAIFVGCGLEFTTMRVGVAIHAHQLPRPVGSVFARGLMTLFAFQLEMFAFEFKRASLVRVAGK